MKEFLIEHLPFWPSLSEWDQANLLEHTKLRSVPPNQVKNLFEQDSIGVNLIKSGRIRVFAASEEGEEINLYRLFPGDACVLNLLGPAENQKLNLSAEAEVETEIYAIPGTLYAQICARNCDVRDFDRKMVSRRLEQIVAMLENIAFTSVSRRLAQALLYHSALWDSDEISITHEALAKDVATAREVITRILSQFQKEGLVTLHRGKIILINKIRLNQL